MNNWIIISCTLLYMALLFAVAYFAEYRSRKGKSIINNPYIYSLSLGVYCTAWTYYGSVGRAANSGIEFLSIYLGPTIIAFIFLLLQQKIIRIAKVQRINSIADFISSRYGKNISLGVVVTIFCVLGIIPYVSIQLKAISNSFDIIISHNSGDSSNGSALLNDSTFYFTALLALFAVLFGTRSVDSSERHEGLVAAIAFESIIKLVAFIAAGLFVSYGLFNGPSEIFTKASAEPALQKLFTLGDNNSYITWTGMIFLSMMALLFLPRQFQVGVIENTNEQHLKKASWLFPLYLFLINLFVLPIAIGGKLILGNTGIDADTYVLALPIHFNQNLLTLLVYIGGFSAATSMIIVETIALSTMVSNNIIMPVFLSIKEDLSSYDNKIRFFISNTRRIAIILILALAYAYDKLVAEHFSLVSIGLVSFAAVAQFAPALIGGVFWKQASKNGALTGIIVGFIIWLYTLVIPSMAGSGMIDNSIMNDGLFGISLLKPYALFGLEGMDSIIHSLFWSLLFNTACFFIISIFDNRSSMEIYQAEVFVDVFKHASRVNSETLTWRSGANIDELKNLLGNFIGHERANNAIHSYAMRNKLNLETKTADPRLLNFSERILSGVIGAASARIMVESISKEEKINIDEVLSILRESQQFISLNKELTKKSSELQKASDELRSANEQLKQMDEMKDEFLYTVTHELRTPLTSIRALSEIIHDNPDIPEEDKQEYLGAIVKETERLSHLITQVLNLERYESGRQRLQLGAVNLNNLIRDSLNALQPLANEKKANMQFKDPQTIYTIQCDKDLISQVLYNLLSNAVKFVPVSTGKINVSVRNDYDELQVWIEDNGKGVPDELHELIFDKFFQAKNQTLKKPEGSGLGLTICKKIIEMHGGKIWVENAGGGGSRFIFTLPYN